MWLFTPDGFYSVVTGEEFGHPLQVRARSADDLDGLRSTHFPKLGESVRITGRDYPVRAFTTHENLAECLSGIARSISYSNFKNEVSSRQGHGRARIYADVWRDCLRIETGNGAGND